MPIQVQMGKASATTDHNCVSAAALDCITDGLYAIRQETIGRVVSRGFDPVQDDLAGEVVGILGSGYMPALLESRGARDYYVD